MSKRNCVVNPSLGRRTLLWLAVSLTLSAWSAAGSVKVEHEARSLQPGEVVLVRVTAVDPIESVAATALDEDVPFFETDDPRVREGLVGLDLAIEPGSYSVRIAGRAGGQDFTVTDTLRVTAKKFPVRRITVEEKFANPPASVQERIAREQKLVASIFKKTTGSRYWTAPFHRPVPGIALSSFGKRSIVNGQARSPHSGTDFRGAAGTPIEAPNNGRVVLAQDLYYSGNTVIIDHGLGLYSYLAHLSAFRVKAGEAVRKGSVIGLVGATGRVTGPHLHWTTRLLGARVDPLSLMGVVADLPEAAASH